MPKPSSGSYSVFQQYCLENGGFTAPPFLAKRARISAIAWLHVGEVSGAGMYTLLCSPTTKLVLSELSCIRLLEMTTVKLSEPGFTSAHFLRYSCSL